MRSNYRESDSSASLVRSIQGYWRRGFAEKSNLGFGRSKVVFVLDVELWTSSIPSAGSLWVNGTLPNQFTFFCGYEDIQPS